MKVQKKQDEFIDSLSVILQFIEARKKPLIILGALAVIVVAFIVWLFYADRAATERAWLNLAMTDMQAAMAVRFGGDEQETQKIRERLLEDYLSIARKSSGASAAPIALYKAGNVLYELGRYDEAIATYRQMAHKFRRDPLSTSAEYAIGCALEAKGKLQEAAKQFETVAHKAPEFIAVQAHVDCGRCYQKLGEVALAEAAYRRAIEAAPDSGLALLAERELSDLSKGSTEDGKEKNKAQR